MARRGEPAIVVEAHENCLNNDWGTSIRYIPIVTTSIITAAWLCEMLSASYPPLLCGYFQVQANNLIKLNPPLVTITVVAYVYGLFITHEYLDAVLLGLTSVLLPFVRLILTLYAWLAPPSRLSVRARSRMLSCNDFLGRQECRLSHTSFPLCHCLSPATNPAPSQLSVTAMF